jgi:lipoate-protein ligase B
MIRKCQISRLGRVDYDEAVKKQMALVERVQADRNLAYLLLLTHDNVFTLGRSARREHLLVSDNTLKQKGIVVREIKRGGDITYHGPGQIVGYPILSLLRHGFHIRQYFLKLEDVLIRVLARYGVEGRHDEEYTGVWVGHEKVAALGVGVSKWVTFHGFALNVNTDLSFFQMIVPCGISHKRVTSMAKLLGRPVDEDEVMSAIEEEFLKEFKLQRC